MFGMDKRINKSAWKFFLTGTLNLRNLWKQKQFFFAYKIEIQFEMKKVLHNINWKAEAQPPTISKGQHGVSKKI